MFTFAILKISLKKINLLVKLIGGKGVRQTVTLNVP